MMEDLRNSILTLQRLNVYNENFVSSDDLRKVLTEDALRSALRDRISTDDCRLEPYNIEDVLKAVIQGAHRIFAILVHIRRTSSILQFMRHDRYQASGLDNRLPFRMEELRAIFPAQIVRNEFYERQWHYSSPVFCDSVVIRDLPVNTILPFVNEEPLGDGAFGDVYRIEIPPSHLCIESVSKGQRELVRKEFRPRNDYPSAHETELRNLSTLKRLGHPNIIELFGCYQYKNKVNLIFPRAQGGTLKDFLEKPRSQPFMSDASILVALAGLCSAVSAVHRCFVPEHRLELIGCHHDLKSSNVLVEDSKFLLADFGLSRFKDASQSSATRPRTVCLYYSAPEYCRSDSHSQEPTVGRSSDIWSLGCIIAEVVQYMLQGTRGVKDFEERRQFEEGCYVRNWFHRGGEVNPVVTAWIEKLQNSDSRTQRMLGKLLLQTLQYHPLARAQAREVEVRMRIIATDAACQPIDEAYEDVCKNDDSIQPTLERTRFDSWRYACGILEPEPDNADLDVPFSQMYEGAEYTRISEILAEIHNELNLVSTSYRNPRSRIYEPLRQLNDQLLDSLSTDDKDRASAYLKIKILSKTSDAMALAKIGEGDTIGKEDKTGPSQVQRLSVLAAIVKCIREVMEERPVHGIEPHRLQPKEQFGDLKVQQLRTDDNESQIPVVVESKTYLEHYGNKRTAIELQERLEDVTKLLMRASLATETDSFRVLRCVGFYQDLPNFSYGLVYKFPPVSSPSAQQFVTLQSALKETQKKQEDRPSLEQRFQLARALAGSVLMFHTVSWVQKSISSFNVAFFHPSGKSWLTAIADPYFFGFLHSRSSGEDSFTEGPIKNPYHQDYLYYQHPEYRVVGPKNPRYRAEYDYYSLGLILLEIGLWKPLRKVLETLKNASTSDSHSPSQLNALLLQKCVPLLRHSMGTRYQKIVETCLRGLFEEVPSELDERTRQSILCQSFFSLVVERLAKCNI